MPGWVPAHSAAESLPVADRCEHTQMMETDDDKPTSALAAHPEVGQDVAALDILRPQPDLSVCVRLILRDDDSLTSDHWTPRMKADMSMPKHKQ